jgi:hypothetical protein
MAISHTGSPKSVTTSATNLTGADEAGDVGQVGQNVLIQNLDASKDVFLGGTGVTTSAYGHKLAAGLAVAVQLAPGESIYGVVSSGTASVGLLYQGV